ncbi:flagellar biosynthesis protein FlhF [Hydrogenimonas thermophila]|uniref:Flagellar biosynthesis protein FlhF n=1 Tax=Hydrogenimonas thermophila TaxID=223786 RepID=A0A1I5LUI6_9BACT|nr:flagellar biosynthesis protein FlhF [Hydrogenimonas thermophila]WOE70439.1 flagellar biosynthesis protein FlhF [Hydrogenimonas thermophila]WOE72956.1 flagellar biosynthesis protein FlhF [Hydrogenimonas thermophila]SFP00902.1 flagellar biosynthesis protein FlhF [Hydrogenimonas thermophila]
MKLMTFTAPTPAQALKAAQKECGEDALVVSTKQIQKKTLTQPAIYEVVVAVEDKKPEPEKPKQTIKPKPQVKSRRSERLVDDPEEVLVNISEAARQISEIANVSKPTYKKAKNRQEIKEETVENSSLYSKRELEELQAIKNELGKLADKVKLIQNMVWEEKKPAINNGMIPPEFAEIYRIAKTSGMDGLHLDEIMRLTLEHMPLQMRTSTQTVRRYFKTLLRKMVPVRLEQELTPPQKKIMMFVGPTGVGKTTTLAKLAARYAYLKDKKYKVGIITLDTYRIGAVEQLMQYAKMMRIGIEAVVDPPEFITALQTLRHMDYILIDTVGSSQYDKEKIDKLQQFLISHTEIGIDVSLVLSAPTKLEDMRTIYQNFSPLGIDTLIFTKLDETLGFGNIFSLVYETEKPVSYLSAGQEVPDDLMCADSDYLVECMLTGCVKKGEK